MPEITPTELVYDGEEVSDGTVPVAFMIDALEGFAAAYNKLAERTQPRDIEYTLRVTGIRKDSAHILVDIVEWAKANPTLAGVAVQTGTALAAGAYIVCRDIAKYFIAKKHMKGKPVGDIHIHLEGANIFLQNDDKERLPLTKGQAEIVRAGLLDAEVDKMTAPLDAAKVDKFELRSRGESLADVEKKDRGYYVHTTQEVTKSQDNVSVIGKLNSLTKDKMRGMLHTDTGKHIPYRYVGDDQHAFLRAFAHEGPVRAIGKVSFDVQLNPSAIAIRQITPLQGHMFPTQGRRR